MIEPAVITPTSVYAQNNTSVIETVQRCIPSIVSITVENTELLKKKPSAALDAATGRLIIARGVRAVKQTRTGAGVIFHPSGIITTTAHTVTHAGRIMITFYDGTTVEGTVIWAVPEEDLAFIRVTPPYPLTPIEVANSENASIGDDVFTIGHSEQLEGSLIAGTITGFALHPITNDPLSRLSNLIRTDFHVYKGDSGDPVLDRDGKLLGIITVAHAEIAHISFAIPSNAIVQHYMKLYKEQVKE